MADDLDFQNISTVQNSLQPQPVTVAAATTIAPTTFLTLVTGTTTVATITPPVTGTHLLALQFTTTTPGTVATTGNILLGSTTIAQNVPILLIYNPITAKYVIVGGKSA